MKRFAAFICLVMSGFALTEGQARAEKLVVVLAADRIGITSSFSGAEVVAITIVERDAQSVPRSGDYDAVVTVRGPERTQVVRRKVRWAGLWVNGPSRTYVDAPTYFAALANRPFAELADDKLRAEKSIGLDSIKLSTRGRLPGGPEDKAFRDAFVSFRKADGLYYEGDKNITFINDTVFRTRIPLPTNTPVGKYNIEVLLLSGGAVISKGDASFELVKEGFEASVFRASRQQPIAYGVFSVIVALGMGWVAGIVFRRN